MIWNDRKIREELEVLHASLENKTKKLNSLSEQFESLKDQHFALGKVAEEQSHQLGVLREEIRVRYGSISNDLTESESRLMTLIEELQEPNLASEESDILKAEETPSRGLTRWSERKRARAAESVDPSKWKQVPKEAPKKEEKENGDLSRT